MNVIRSLLVWLCFIPVAILNGGLRQYVLVRWFGEVGANALSGGLTGGISFRELLSAYNPMSGNLWLLVVVTTFGAPRLVSNKERR